MNKCLDNLIHIWLSFMFIRTNVKSEEICSVGVCLPNGYDLDESPKEDVAVYMKYYAIHDSYKSLALGLANNAGFLFAS